MSNTLKTTTTPIESGWATIDTPCLLLDLDRLERNITAMARRAEDAGVALRPHFKTHKSTSIASRQAEAGVTGFTVSKLDEAEVLLDAGFDDVLVATQIVAEPKIARAIRLARLGRLTIAVDDIAAVGMLAYAATRARVTIDVSIEIDSGLGRCGIRPGDAGDFAKSVSGHKGVRLTGVFTHGGHVYGSSNGEDLMAAAREEINSVTEAADSIEGSRDDAFSTSIGTTPTVLSQDAFPGVSEIRPGNYVFLDAIQVSLGVARPEDVALTVGATVISRPAPDRAVVDAGSKSIGLDKGAHGGGLLNDFGRLVGRAGKVTGLSEEHGILEIPASSSLVVGDRVRIRPNHACSVARLHSAYVGLRGSSIEEEITIDAHGSR